MDKIFDKVITHLNNEYYSLEKMLTNTLFEIGSYTFFTEDTEDEYEYDIVEFTDYEGDVWKVMGYSVENDKIKLKVLSCEDGEVYTLTDYSYDRVPVYNMILRSIQRIEFPDDED